MAFDPDDAAKPGSGVFGLPTERGAARIVLFPAPFDATTSYGGGAARGAEAIRRASAQVDLLDHQFGAAHEAGIFMEAEDEVIAELSREARALAAPIIARGGAGAGDEDAVKRVDAACEHVRHRVHERTARILKEGRIPGLVGGDHSTPLGAIEAAAQSVEKRSKGGLGLLQVDAHMDLREAFEGFAFSHASITHNVVMRAPGVTRVVQVGLRDCGAGERRLVEGSGGRIVAHFDYDWWRFLDAGEPFAALCRRAVEPLPENVWVTFDIDGLDPALCPQTGTPVPGGLTFNQASMLLDILARSGRRVVGFDLVEVSPGEIEEREEEAGDSWDAMVGARVLYKLCGCALAASRGAPG